MEVIAQILYQWFFFNFATFAYRRVIVKKKGQNVGDGAAPTPCKWCFLDEVLGSTNW